MDHRQGALSIRTFAAIVVVVAVAIIIIALMLLDVTGEKGSGLGEEFVYDTEGVVRIDPNLIRYEESSEPIKTGFTSSHAIAVGPDGRIYVAGDRAVRVFEQAGASVDEIELPTEPRCLTVAGNGNIYVGFKNHVGVYDIGSKRLAQWRGLGKDAVLTSIAVSNDDVFVADAGNRIVLHYDTAGKLINRIGEKDQKKNVPGFVIPSPHFDLAVGRDGLLRVVNPGRHRIEAYTFDGFLEFSWGKFSMNVEGFCGCCNPVNFAILDDDSFVTCEKGLVRAKIYDPVGTFVAVVAGPEQLIGDGGRVCTTVAECQVGSFDVAATSGGRFLVLDTIKNAVRIFTKKKVN